MPLYMDFHHFENVTIEEVKKAHLADVAIQDKYGVKYHQFWINQKEGTVFCLTEGPDKETCELVHRLAHGNIACALTEVESGFFKTMMGEFHWVEQGVVKEANGSIDLGYRHVLVAMVRGNSKSGNARDLLHVPLWAKAVVSGNTKDFGGREVKWATDDSLISVFNDGTDAMKCACRIHDDLLHNGHEPAVVFRIGISGDQPVTENGDFFTKTIKLAHHLGEAAAENQILVSSLVRKLCKEDPMTNASFVRCLDSPDEQLIMRLLDFTDRNLPDKDFTIENLCKNLGVSRTRLYRKITSLTGRAPNDFLRDLRMEKALSLLKYHAGNVSQVALDVGYNNPSYFSKCFFDTYGITPSEISGQHLPGTSGSPN